MEGYHAPQSPPAVADPARQAAWEGYITLITTLLPTLRSGRQSPPWEIAAAWRQLQAAVQATGSDIVAKLHADLPERPSAADLGLLTAELARLAQVQRPQP